MSAAVELSADGRRLTVYLPLTLRKRGGRKLVMVPQEDVIITPPRRPVIALVKAIARAYRWQRMLEQGSCASAEDIAKKEKISVSYVNRLLQLTLLSPAIVEIILNGQQPATISTVDLLRHFPAEWNAQNVVIG